jgi:phosphoglycerate dehydrogenase-like enzyme
MAPALPPREALTIAFAHVAYRLGERFRLRETGIRHIELRSHDELAARIGEADVLVVSGFWRNELAARAVRLRFIQSISAGVDQFQRNALAAHGIRLASAKGANERAVAEHAIALMLALARRLPEARDNQRRGHWRGMMGDIARREDELGGKTLLVVGLGRIGARLAALAKAFGMRVIGLKRDLGRGDPGVDALRGSERLIESIAEADYVALTCPLTPETAGLIGPAAFAAMKPTAYLVNVARGRVVDEAALIAALRDNRIAGAGIDCTHDEPLPAASPLWACETALITPHTAGETRRYEDNVIDLLLENLERLWRGETALRNQIV